LQGTIGDAEFLGRALQAAGFVFQRDADGDFRGAVSNVPKRHPEGDGMTDGILETGVLPLAAHRLRGEWAFVLGNVSDGDGAAANMAFSHAGHELAEVADVAGIIAEHHIVPHCGIQLRSFTLAMNLPEEVLGKGNDVLPPLIERRQLAGPTGDAVIEVEPEGTAGLFFFQVPVGRADETEINILPRVAADPLVSAFLNDAQQFGLQAERQFSDFIEKEGAAIGERKRAIP